MRISYASDVPWASRFERRAGGRARARGATASRTGKSASSSISRTAPSSRTSTGSSRSSASPPEHSCERRSTALTGSWHAVSPR